MFYMIRAVSPPIIRSSRTVHTASGMCQACLLLRLCSICFGRFSAHHQELKNCTHSIWYVAGLLVATSMLYLYVSGGFSSHHQELKNCAHSIWNVPGLLVATSMLYMFRVVSPPIIRSSRTVHTASGMCQACLLLPLAVDAVCTVLELLMVGGVTPRNMYSIDNRPLAVAASKSGIYQMLCVQSLTS